MSFRYLLLTELVALAGAFVVVVTFAFEGSTIDAIAFAVSIATLVASAVAAAQAPALRRRFHRSLWSLAAVLSAWNILVALGIFSGSTQRWLIFAGAAALVALSVVGRVVRERDAVGAAARPAPLVGVAAEAPASALAA